MTESKCENVALSRLLTSEEIFSIFLSTFAIPFHLFPTLFQSLLKITSHLCESSSHGLYRLFMLGHLGVPEHKLDKIRQDFHTTDE